MKCGVNGAEVQTLKSAHVLSQSCQTCMKKCRDPRNLPLRPVIPMDGVRGKKKEEERNLTTGMSRGERDVPIWKNVGGFCFTRHMNGRQMLSHTHA